MSHHDPHADSQRHSLELEHARRSVLVRKPVSWRVAAALIAELEAAWGALDARTRGTAPEAGVSRADSAGRDP